MQIALGDNVRTEGFHEVTAHTHMHGSCGSRRNDSLHARLTEKVLLWLKDKIVWFATTETRL